MTFPTRDTSPSSAQSPPVPWSLSAYAATSPYRYISGLLSNQVSVSISCFIAYEVGRSEGISGSDPFCLLVYFAMSRCVP